jgi:hypothetical protein
VRACVRACARACVRARCVHEHILNAYCSKVVFLHNKCIHIILMKCNMGAKEGKDGIPSFVKLKVACCIR